MTLFCFPSSLRPHHPHPPHIAPLLLSLPPFLPDLSNFFSFIYLFFVLAAVYPSHASRPSTYCFSARVASYAARSRRSFSASMRALSAYSSSCCIQSRSRCCAVASQPSTVLCMSSSTLVRLRIVVAMSLAGAGRAALIMPYAMAATARIVRIEDRGGS